MVRQIKPMYMIMLLATLFAVVLVKLNTTRQEHQRLMAELAELKQTALHIDEHRKVWKEGPDIQQDVERLLKHPKLRGTDLKVTGKQGSLKVVSEGLGSEHLDYVLNKLLNGPYAITALDIRKKSHVSASLLVEVAR